MDFMSEMLSAAQTKFGKAGCYVAADYEKHLVGVHAQPLMLQKLLGTNIIPLSKIIELAGPPASCKSAVLFSWFKLFLSQGYNACLIETENKLSPSLLSSVLGEYQDNLLLFEGCAIVEEWQTKLSFVIDNYAKHYHKTIKEREVMQKKRDACKKAEAKAKYVLPDMPKPLIIGLDSLGGPQAKDTYDTIKAEGHGSKVYPAEALLNSKYFSSLPEKIFNLPITFVYTNHKMLNMSAGQGETTEKSKGGATPAFFAALRIFFDEATAVKKPNKRESFQIIKMHPFKNSLNERGSRMRLPMRWTKDIIDDDEVQTTYFEWEEALVRFLAPKSAGFSYDREAVKTFLTVIYHTENSFSCKELNLSKVPPKEIGEAIMANETLVTKLSPYLGIKQWRVYNDRTGSHEYLRDRCRSVEDTEEASST